MKMKTSFRWIIPSYDTHQTHDNEPNQTRRICKLKWAWESSQRVEKEDKRHWMWENGNTSSIKLDRFWSMKLIFPSFSINQMSMGECERNIFGKKFLPHFLEFFSYILAVQTTQHLTVNIEPMLFVSLLVSTAHSQVSFVI